MRNSASELRRRLARELAQGFEGELRFDRYSRVFYATDASNYEVEPLGVVVPMSAQDVRRAVQVAAAHGVPLTPRGGGTSLEGQTVGPGLQIDFSKYLNRILRINAEERWVEVEPGIVLEDLNRAMARLGLQFAPDVATADRACLGGMLGNNSSGARSLVYGKTVDHVLAVDLVTASGVSYRFEEKSRPQLEALLASPSPEAALYRGVIELTRREAGRVVRIFPKILRRVSGYNLDEMLRGLRAAGYDDLPEWPGEVAPRARLPQGFNLARLVVGSEGTLGVVERARLNLVERPEATALLVGHFSSLEEALEANLALLQESSPSALELMDAMLLGLARRQPEMSRSLFWMEGEPGAVLVAEFSGSRAEVPDMLEGAAALLRRRGLGYAHVPARDAATIAAVWKVRKAGLPLLMGLPGRRKPVAFVEDTAVPPARLLEYVRRFDRLMAAHGTRCAYYAHASVGCLHIRPLLDLKSAEDVARMKAIAADVVELVMEFGGALSGEHGDGKAHSMWHPRLFGPELYQAFRELKALFDPRGIMNPGTIVDAPDMTENLRFGPSYRVQLPTLELDWSQQGGFDEAVELCNGAGVCRKTSSGTMCPSYMVTLEEEHSTRGRANALRAALSGRLPRSELTSPRMYQVLDLCLECKGCKSECPSNVDMARIKLEFLAQYHKVHPPSLRTRLFAHVEGLNRLGCATAPLSNWLGRSPLWPLLARLLGIDPRRRLPTFARPTFSQWWRRRPVRGQGRPQVALFVDTFAEYNHPEVARCAVEVLEAAGYQVILAPHTCCGRPMISKGLVEPARRRARRNIELLLPLAEGGIPVVGLEPSCILSLRDEYLALVPGEATRKVASVCLTFEELLAGRDLPLRPRPGPILVHGHCHQKALVGSAPTLELLRRLPGAEVREVDSGCCGMAGAFGYEAEHYEISEAIGRRRLIPAARQAAQEGATVVAAGTSCRQQLADLARVRALHPAEILAQSLEV